MANTIKQFVNPVITDEMLLRLVKMKPRRRPVRSGSRTAAKPIRRRIHPSTRQRKVKPNLAPEIGTAKVKDTKTRFVSGRNTPPNFVQPSKVNTRVRKSKSFSNSVPPRRTREHLTPGEVDRLLKAARSNRHGSRDHALVLVSYSHALRLSEAIRTRWEDFDLKGGLFHVHRVKGSISGDHFLRGVEIRALRQLKRAGPTSGEFVFSSERGGRLSARGVQKMIERLGVRAGLGALNVHTHMLRHSCGYYMADRGVHLRVIQEYMGHKNIRHTVRYTALSPRKFRRLWDD